MIIKINPPMISIFFPNFIPSLIPRRIPRIDIRPVTIPINIAGYQMLTFSIARLSPIASASMLVARLSIIKLNTFRRIYTDIGFIFFKSGFYHSYSHEREKKQSNPMVIGNDIFQNPETEIPADYRHYELK